MEDSDGKITGRSMQFGCNPIMGQKLIIDSVTKTRASVRKGLTQSFLFHLRPISNISLQSFCIPRTSSRNDYVWYTTTILQRYHHCFWSFWCVNMQQICTAENIVVLACTSSCECGQTMFLQVPFNTFRNFHVLQF